MKISTATVPASCITPFSLSIVVAKNVGIYIIQWPVCLNSLPLTVSIDHTIMVRPGERGALTSPACVVVVVVAPRVVVIGRVVGVVVIGRVVGVVVIGRVVGVMVVRRVVCHVVIRGIVIVVTGRIVAIAPASTKEES